jgi:hypothetical protein
LEGQVLARGDGLRFQALSGDGAWVAYSERSNSDGGGASSVDLFVVQTAGGSPLRLARAFDLSFARFVGTTLYLVRGVDSVPEALGNTLDEEAELLAWRPEDTEPTSLAMAVDPGAFRTSKDGKLLSIESNDTRFDSESTAQLTIIDNGTLSTSEVVTCDHPRGRLTRDSQWVFFSCWTKGVFPFAVQGFNLIDDSHYEVAKISDRHWKLSPDGRWLIYGAPEGGLMRILISGGDPEVISTSVGLSAGGRQFDLSSGGDISFVVSNELHVAPIEGGRETNLGPLWPYRILAHIGSLILYAGGSDALRLYAVSSSGGVAQDLGPYREDDRASRYLLDQRDDALLTRDANGGIRLLKDTAKPALTLTESGQSARFLPNGRVIFLDAKGKLMLHHKDGDSKLQSNVTGPFGLEPKLGRWYVTSVQCEGETTLLLGSIP